MLSFEVNENKCQTYLSQNTAIQSPPINPRKRVFLLSSKGSMSLEASLAVPICVFFLMTIMFGIEAVRLQANVFEALHRAAMSAFASQDGSENEICVKKYMESVDNGYICVRNGDNGMNVHDSSTISQNGRLRIDAEYEITPFINIIPIGNIKIHEYVEGHAFSGYVDDNRDTDSHLGEYVFVTETGSKFHRNRDCSYIRPTVTAVDWSNITVRRNNSMGKYYPCDVCNPSDSSIVYITPEGNRFHGSRDCPSLKRTVYIKLLKEAMDEGYTPCSKCG